MEHLAPRQNPELSMARVGAMRLDRSTLSRAARTPTNAVFDPKPELSNGHLIALHSDEALNPMGAQRGRFLICPARR